MRKSSLLFISPVTPALNGIGLAKRAYNNIRALSQRHEVYLLIIPAGRKDCKPDANSQNLYKKKKIGISLTKDFRLFCGLVVKKIFRLLGFSPILLSGELTTLTKGRIERGFKAFRSVSFDIIHVFRIYMIPALKPFLKGFSGFLHLDMDDIESVTRRDIAELYLQNRMMNEYGKAKHEAQLFLKMEAEELERFDRVFVCSRIDRDRVIRAHPDLWVEVLPNIVDIPIRGSNKDGHQFRFLICANFNYYPNIDGLKFFIHDILPLIFRSTEKKFLIDVVGPGLNSELRKELKKHPVFKYHGEVHSVDPYIRSSIAVIVPIRGGGGTRIKILEALAYGKSVVSTSKGSEGLPVKDKTDLLIADDPDEFAKCCLELLHNPGKWVRLGLNGKNLVERLFTRERISEMLSGTMQMERERNGTD